jgi:hypothetical protein
MRKHDLESAKQTSSRDIRSELTEAQLSLVSGGSLYHACATGKHFQDAKITAR